MDEVIEIARRGGGRAENDNEDGDAKDGTDLATHLDDGAAGGGLIRSKPGSTGGDESRNNQTDADSDDEPSRQDGGRVVGMCAEAEADEHSSTTHQQRTNGGNNSGRYQRRVSPQSDRSHRHHDWAWSDTEAGLDGRPPPALLELQPQLDPCTRARVSAPMATINNSPPHRSGTRVSTECLMFGAKMAAATSAAIPMGMFRMKIHRHDAWTRSPPSAGPAAAPREPLTAQIWMECFRRSAGIAVNIKPRLVGTSAAAPIACTQRSPTMTQRSLLSAHPRLPSVKTASPKRNACLTP